MSGRSSITFPTFVEMIAGYELVVSAITAATDDLAASRPQGAGVWDSAPDLAEALGTVEQNHTFVQAIYEAVVEHGHQSIGGVGVVADIGVNRTLGTRGAQFFDSDGDRDVSDRLLQVQTIRAVRDHNAQRWRAGAQVTAAERAAFDQALADGASPHAAWMLATMTPTEVVEALRLDTYEEAGIEGEAWRPELGLDANIEIVDAVYEYYPVLFEADPSMYWVAIASVAGPQFYAGFLDINTMRKRAEGQVEFALEGPAGPAAGGDPYGTGLLTSAEIADATWMMETTFLGMQRQIFDDMAVQHHAYQIGGMPMIQAYAEGDPVLPDAHHQEQLVDAWETFEAGDLERSTAMLVDREQRFLIQDDYDEIWNHSAATKLFITGASVNGSVDPLGGESFYDHRITPDGGISLPTIELGSVSRNSWLPAMRIGSVELDGFDPSANVANEHDRLVWIHDEINGSVFQLAADDLDELLRIAMLPHQEEAGRYRMVAE